MQKVKEFIKEYAPQAKEFVAHTLEDFKSVWITYPNVLIWCAIAIVIAFLL